MAIDSIDTHGTRLDAGVGWQFMQAAEGMLDLHDATDATSFELPSLRLSGDTELPVPHTVTVTKVDRFNASAVYTSSGMECRINRSVVIGADRATNRVTGEPVDPETADIIIGDLVSYRDSTLAGAAFVGILGHPNHELTPTW